ncbi:hypothetical protein ACLB2K_013117 [Fragaria x ananassa]
MSGLSFSLHFLFSISVFLEEKSRKRNEGSLNNFPENFVKGYNAWYFGSEKPRMISEKSMEQKETAEQELLMKGPRAFPMERGESYPLEGSTRYRSTVSEDLSLQVARSIKFPLSKYLYRR